jgi:hypothetical protein
MKTTFEQPKTRRSSLCNNLYIYIYIYIYMYVAVYMNVRIIILSLINNKYNNIMHRIILQPLNYLINLV